MIRLTFEELELLERLLKDLKEIALRLKVIAERCSNPTAGDNGDTKVE